MSSFRVTAFTLIVLCGAAIASAQTSPAFAEPVDLRCHIMGNAIAAEIYLSVDTGVGTVTQWTTGYTRDQVPANAATVSADSVKWSTSDGGAYTAWTLDRVAGTLNEIDANGNSLGYNCTKAASIL
jgi:hypothetical protein